jgi:orotidine-5'-phosphate decarboxylase
MNRSELIHQINQKKSFLCVGLDTDPSKIPTFLKDFDDPIFEFNKRVIDATKDLCVAYKPNIAFYESLGPKGWESLEKTINYIPDNIFTIADAKRGDIGNTSKMYAKTFFEYFDFDAVTVAPYMGVDSVSPFLEFEDKWVILLGLTSNKGSNDFQRIESSGTPLYESHPESFAEVRDMAKEHFFLVPGIGAQGGDLHGVVTNGINEDCGLLINSSRGIIYAGGDSEDFDVEVKKSAADLQGKLGQYL